MVLLWEVMYRNGMEKAGGFVLVLAVGLGVAESGKEERGKKGDFMLQLQERGEGSRVFFAGAYIPMASFFYGPELSWGRLLVGLFG
jgi:hypothetical protein